MPIFDNLTGLDNIRKELKERVDYLANIINTLTPEIRRLSDSIIELNKLQKELNSLIKQQISVMEALNKAIEKLKPPR
ncbi:MAG: hypothetical protein QXL84_06355 [Thermoplasmata archaeon]